jgi:hypothetical protein
VKNVLGVILKTMTCSTKKILTFVISLICLDALLLQRQNNHFEKVQYLHTFFYFTPAHFWQLFYVFDI